jgi:adenylate cyclase class IV
MKKWNLHDDAREEIEIKFETDDFDKLKSLFLALGYEIEIVRLRKRIQFDLDGIEVSLDDTTWYGKILELEILTDEEGQSSALQRLQEKFKELWIAITPKEEFAKKYEFYKENRKSLIPNFSL